MKKNYLLPLWALLIIMVGVFQGCHRHNHYNHHEEGSFEKNHGQVPHTTVYDGNSAATLHDGLVQLHKVVPTDVVVGVPYVSEFHLTALDDASNIIVTDTLPAGVTFDSATPDARLEGGNVVWTIPHLMKGESVTLSGVYRANKDGDLHNCVALSSLPFGCLVSTAGSPALEITKSGPARAVLGEEITYDVTVINSGTSTVQNAVMSDPVPNGLSHASGKNMLTFELGEIDPEMSKTVPVTFKTLRTGIVTNIASATADNVGVVQASASTEIIEYLLNVVKTGPETAFVGKTADYKVLITNPGSEDLKNIVVVDRVPGDLTIVSSSGGSVSGREVRWDVPSLNAGETKTFTVTLQAHRAGTFCNSVDVSTSEGMFKSAEACTDWKGYPALLIEVVDTEDPLLVGGTTTYRIRVLNQGTAADENLHLVGSFSSNMKPLSASGATEGTVSGQSVSFQPYSVLKAKEEVQYFIQAQAVSVGDARFKIEMRSDVLTSPVTEEESTQVY